MRLPIAWLRDFVDVDLDAAALSVRFASLGFPVESVERRPDLRGIVVGKIAKLERHPSADRLQICTVDVGAAEPLGIATGATNVAEGQIVPVATVGARLLDLAGKPLAIEPRAMRGYTSHGMLCSAAELALEGEWFEDGIMQLEPDLPLGLDVVAHYRLHDPVLDVEITSNRVDAMCVLGLARELAAALGTTLREPEITTHRSYAAPPTSAELRVTLASPDCTHFIAQRFSGLQVRPAPAWMRIRLALAGQRPINNLVDISNYVMLEVGQPLHFYDYERIAGHHLIARDARPGEIVRTLDGESHEVDARTLVIADDEIAQGLAGLKGGAASEVTGATRELVLEAATFSGPRIRRMASAAGLRTDASSRHEKTVPAALNAFGAARAAVLLEAEGARVHEPLAVGSIASAAPLALAPRDVHRLLGIDARPPEIAAALRSLGFVVESDAADSNGTMRVVPPPWRGDVTIVADLVEEVGRVLGYDRIDVADPPVFAHPLSSATYVRERDVAHALAGLGYRELVSLALEPAATRERLVATGIDVPLAVEIANPLSEDQRYLRFSLLPGLLAHAARFAGDVEFGTFEIGHVFRSATPDPIELSHAVWLYSVERRDEPFWHDSGFMRAKADAIALVRQLVGRSPDVTASDVDGLHPGKAASLALDGIAFGFFGAVDPRALAVYDIDRAVYAGTLDLGLLPAHALPRFIAPPRFPPVVRDLAVIVPSETPASSIEAAVAHAGDGSFRSARVFDEYRGPQVPPDRKSVTVRVVLGRDDATLTDADADVQTSRILGALHDAFGAEVRS